MIIWMMHTIDKRSNTDHILDPWKTQTPSSFDLKYTELCGVYHNLEKSDMS